jgi:hypothetical protein
MTSGDDSLDEMHALLFGDAVADDLLSGRIDPDDAPPAFRVVALLVRAARPPAGSAPVAGEEQLAAAFVAATAEPARLARIAQKTRQPVLAKILSAKAAVIATIVLGGGVAAAATGALPASIQSAVAGAASHIGVSLPRPGATAGGSGSQGGLGANTFGLCNAYSSVTKGYTDFTNPALTNSRAFERLEAAASANNESVQAYCAAAVASTTTTTVSTTSTTSSTTTSTTSTSTTTTTAPGTTTTVPANLFGQCTAYSSVTKDFTDFSSPALTHSQAFLRLEAAASAAGGSVETYCAAVLGLPPTTTTSTSTTTTTIAPSSRKKHHGKPTTTGPPKGHGHGNS